MRKQDWKEEFAPLVIVGLAQFASLRLLDWAKANAATDENAQKLLENHLAWAPYILGLVSVYYLVRFVRRNFDFRGVTFGEWLKSSALFLALGFVLVVAIHLDHAFALVGLALPEAAEMATRLQQMAVYSFLNVNLTVRAAADLLVLLLVLLGFRTGTVPAPELVAARDAERAGDWEKAGDIYLRMGDVKAAKSAFKRGNQQARLAALVQRDDPKDAAKIYESAGPAYAWEASRAWELAGNAEKAKQLADAALAEARANLRFERMLEIGEALQDQTVIAEGARRLAEVRPAGLGKTELWKMAAAASRAIGKTSDAAEAYRAAGDFPMAALLFLEVQRYADAAQDFERAGDLASAAQAAGQAGDNKSAWELSARDLETKGELLAAADAWCHAQQWERAAGLYERKGSFDRAAAVWRDLNRLDRAAPLFEKAGDGQSAAMAYEAIGQSERAALFYRQLGQIEKAAALFKAANKFGDAAAALYSLGRFDEALPLFQRAAQPLLAAKCALYSGQRERTWELLTAVPRSGPGVRELFVELSQAHLTAGEYRDAALVLRELLGNLPVTHDNVSAQQLLAHALQAAGETADAKAKWAQIQAFDPSLLPPSVATQGQASQNAPTVNVTPGRTSSAPPPGAGSSGSRPISSSPSSAAHRLGTPAAGQAPARPPSGTFGSVNVNSSGAFAFGESPEVRYEVVQELGRGGMGVVHKAMDKKLDRFVALKILPWQLHGDETAVRYFAREAKAIAALKHPNVVQIYDYGEGFGSLYLAMEFLEGPNFQTLLKNDPERVKENWRRWFVQATRGVAAAHAKGILHRDLKPANLMLDEHQTLRILDFGLARPEGDSALTSKLIGTPAFLPPEVLRGEVPTPASDVYSLGATFYTLATGRWPYVGDDILVARLERDPDDPRPFAPQLHDDEVEVLMKSLARHRPERYPDAGELLGALLSLEG